MIKKMYQSLKKRLQKLPLYWKTWLITIITLVATLIIFFLVFSLFATKFLENNQKNKFNKTVSQITNEVEKNGIDSDVLNKYMIEGYSVIISENDEVLYPVYTSTEGVAISSVQATTQSVSLVGTESGNSSLVTSKLIYYQNHLLRIDIFYPNIIDPGDIKDTLISIIPYFVLTGLLVAFGVSWIYSRYFTAKINQLNKLVHKMATSSVSSEYESMAGDELQELKNNVYHMYQELQMTLNQLNEEMDRVQRLESDRQVFLRGATHELKTPIMTMMTTISGLMNHVEGYEDETYHLTQSFNRLQSMSRLVNEMLEISKLEAVVFSGETDLTVVTQEVLSVYDYLIQDQELQVIVKQIPQVSLKFQNVLYKK